MKYYSAKGTYHVTWIIPFYDGEHSLLFCPSLCANKIRVYYTLYVRKTAENQTSQITGTYAKIQLQEY